MPKKRLCNEEKLGNLQDKFFTIKWNESKETLPMYIERIRTGTRMLQIPITNNILVNRFKAGLSYKLRQQIMVIKGSFDTIVSLVSRLVAEQQRTPIETVREVREQTYHRSGSVEPAREAREQEVAGRVHGSTWTAT